MELSINRKATSIVITLVSGATGIATLLVANRDEVVMWEIKPLAMQMCSVDGIFGNFAVPMPSQRELLVAPSTAAEIEAPSFPPVSEIVYGKVPEGYYELDPPLPLLRGETYRVTVFSEGFDSGGEFFVA